MCPLRITSNSVFTNRSFFFFLLVDLESASARLLGLLFQAKNSQSHHLYFTCTTSNVLFIAVGDPRSQHLIHTCTSCLDLLPPQNTQYIGSKQVIHIMGINSQKYLYKQVTLSPSHLESTILQDQSNSNNQVMQVETWDNLNS